MTLRGDEETTVLFEPLMISEGSHHRSALNGLALDLALDLAARAAAFRSSLPDQVAVSLATLIAP